MFQGKMKAVTFSFDDAVTQDQRFIRLLNKYGLKGTFNLNSGLLGNANLLIREQVTVAHVKPRKEEIRAIYEGHEIACHTLTHENLSACDPDTVFHQVEDDRAALSEIAGYEVVGMAYPNGTEYVTPENVETIRTRAPKIAYARTTTPTYSLTAQQDLLFFHPTLPFTEWDKMYALAQQLIDMPAPTAPQLLYIWGHTYEFDIHPEAWDRMEEFFRFISGKPDIFYGTNREVLLSR